MSYEDLGSGINFNNMPCIYWSSTTKMSYLQRRVIVYSIMYYENNESCISDREYDAISYQLLDLMNASTQEEKEATTYWYAMHDFDASTGFDIPGRLKKKDKEYLTHIAGYVYKLWKDNSSNEERIRRMSNAKP